MYIIKITKRKLIHTPKTIQLNIMTDFDTIFQELDMNIFSSLTNLDTFINEISYIGFDPIFILGLLAKCEKDPDTFKEDIAKLITISVERGSNVTRMQQKMGSSGVKQVKNLVIKYKIVSKVASKESVTLPRIALCYPWLACSYMIRAINPVVPFQSLPGIPKYCFNPAFASLIPNKIPNDQFLNLSYCHLLCMFRFNRIINPNNTKSNTELKLELEGYFRISNNSEYVPEKARVKLMIDWNLMNSSYMLASEVVAGANLYRELL